MHVRTYNSGIIARTNDKLIKSGGGSALVNVPFLSRERAPLRE